MSFSRDGSEILSGDGTGLQWDATTGRIRLTFQGHSSWIQSFTFSPDHQRILTGSDDKTAKLWEPTTGRELLTLKGHQGGGMAAEFSPDGQRIATASYDGLVRIFDVATPEQVRVWKDEERAADKRVEQFRLQRSADHH